MKTITITITTSYNTEKNIKDFRTIISYSMIIICWSYIEHMAFRVD